MTWWLRPEWTQATCIRCGANIWGSGGDPDWGICMSCWDEEHQEPPPIPCDICGKGDAVTGVRGYGVCSYECEQEAIRRSESDKQED